MAKPGRRPGPSQTREQILQAAREQFAERGYSKTTLRSIADAAHVHPALLHHYFRSKQQLYNDALDLPVDLWEVLSRLLTDTPADQVASALCPPLRVHVARPRSGSLRAMARRTYGRPDGTGMARSHLETVLIPAVRQTHSKVPEPNIAAALSHLVGLTLVDTLIGVRQLDQVSADEPVTRVEPGHQPISLAQQPIALLTSRGRQHRR